MPVTSSKCSLSKRAPGIGRIQINAADYVLENRKGHAEQRADVRAAHAVHGIQTFCSRQISAENGDALIKHLLGNSAADANRLPDFRIAVARKYGRESAAFSIQQHGAMFSRNHLKEPFQDLLLQPLKVRDGMHILADLQ
jgi:hypothetical protein